MCSCDEVIRRETIYCVSPLGMVVKKTDNRALVFVVDLEECKRYYKYICIKMKMQIRQLKLLVPDAYARYTVILM